MHLSEAVKPLLAIALIGAALAPSPQSSRASAQVSRSPYAEAEAKMNAALADLQRAPPDRGGHRNLAISALRQAIQEVRLATTSSDDRH